MGRFFLTVAIAVVLAGVVGWQFGLFTSSADPSDSHLVGGPTTVDPQTLGDWIYPPAKEERQPRRHLVRGGRDPIVFPASLHLIDQLDVSSTNGGEILYIGDGVPEGVTQVTGVAAFMNDSYRQSTVSQGGRSIVKFYRPLEESSEIFEGQMLGELDYAKALNNYKTKLAKVIQAKEEHKVKSDFDKEAQRRFELELRLRVGGGYSKELEDARLTKLHSQFEVTKFEQEVNVADTELNQAEIILEQHQIRSKHNMKRGFINILHKKMGEAVKELEPVLNIYSIDRLMAKAFVEFQDAMQLKRNMIATIEPVYDERPLRVFEGHGAKAPITNVAFIVSGNVLYLVSASEDNFLKVWQQNVQGELANINHREPIRALACSPPNAKQPLCLTGTSDGKIHLWNLNLKQQPFPQPAAVLEKPLDGHQDAVTALAFSPDGAYFASGAADGTIKLWHAEDGKLAYALDAAHGADNPHQGGITALSFTPHSRLVSASRDNTIRIWNLKAKGAHLEGLPITGRSGNVNHLGVSQDGRWMLFDQGKSLHLRALPDGQTINTLKNPGGATPFETLALFSPDASLILTGGAPEGKLQLWRAPAEDSRGFEVRQFVTIQKSPVTCAAFAPVLGGKGFAASGTKDGNVYLWPVPSKDVVDKHRIQNVPIRLLDPTVSAGNRQIRVGVEVQNPDGLLTPGRPVTIVIEQ